MITAVETAPDTLGSKGIFSSEREAELEELYQALGAEGYVQSIRRPEFGEGSFDMQWTADQAGVRLIIQPFEYLPGYNPTGLYSTHTFGEEKTYRDPHMRISEDLSLEEQHQAAGHEIAHHFLMVIIERKWEEFCLSGSLTAPIEEDFCEYFAAKLVDDRMVVHETQLSFFDGNCYEP